MYVDPEGTLRQSLWDHLLGLVYVTSVCTADIATLIFSSPLLQC